MRPTTGMAMTISTTLRQPLEFAFEAEVPIPASTVAILRRGFGADLHLVDAASGRIAHRSSEQPAGEWTPWVQLSRQAADCDRVEFLADEPPLAVLAVPVASNPPNVALGVFVTRTARVDDLRCAAAALGLNPDETVRWARGQSPWTPESLLRVAGMIQDGVIQSQRLAKIEIEAQNLSNHLAVTYEEISLLYRLTHNLKISQSDDDLGRIALEWMGEVVPAEGFALYLASIGGQAGTLDHHARSRARWLTHGQCPIDDTQFGRLVSQLNLNARSRPAVVNPPVTARAGWTLPQIRQLVMVPLAEGENLFGWLAALNHVAGGEFGTVEASLLSSVAAILGIHSGNIELYRQQAELMSGIIRALSSAIDAKDQYTCGHSDRVARFSVRLARELNCSHDQLDTIYLSGLLHDIGKIGINDSVLRKPDKLTEAEYSHIKTHVQVGHRILVDLKKLGEVLPAVLHHHESWDGSGYPLGLKGDAIPLSARIIAVADSYDAMGSDRPYRKGMPAEKIDEIFRSGSGRQWDPQVIDAYFRAREDLRRIASE